MSKYSSKIMNLEDYKEKHNPFDRHELCRNCIDYDDCDFDCQDYKELTELYDAWNNGFDRAISLIQNFSLKNGTQI